MYAENGLGEYAHMLRPQEGRQAAILLHTLNGFLALLGGVTSLVASPPSQPPALSK